MLVRYKVMVRGREQHPLVFLGPDVAHDERAPGREERRERARRRVDRREMMVG